MNFKIPAYWIKKNAPKEEGLSIEAGSIHLESVSVVAALQYQRDHRENALREIKGIHTRWMKGEISADKAANLMESCAVGVWANEEDALTAILKRKRMDYQ